MSVEIIEIMKQKNPCFFRAFCIFAPKKPVIFDQGTEGIFPLFSVIFDFRSEAKILKKPVIPDTGRGTSLGEKNCGFRLRKEAQNLKKPVIVDNSLSQVLRLKTGVKTRYFRSFAENGLMP